MMANRNSERVFALEIFGRIVAVIPFAVGCLFPQPGQAADALKFFKNYFVTGDYAVAGVGLRGNGVLDTQTQAITGTTVDHYATGTIQMGGVPANADILAAFLYWEEIAGASTDPAVLAVGTFRGFKIVGKQIAPGATSAC